MAHQSSYRVKVKFPWPHLARKLNAVGLSTKGIEQLACGEMVGDAPDRAILARFLAEWESAPNSMLPPRVGWEVMVRAQNLLKEIAPGMSDLGIRQLSTGNLVTDPSDRKYFVLVLEDATRDAATFALVAARFKNAGGNYNN
jgi:hypothetical protein